MAGRAALGRALVASGGTVLAIGGATMLVSTVSMGVARAVVMEKKVRAVRGGARGSSERAVYLHGAARRVRPRRRGGLRITALATHQTGAQQAFFMLASRSRPRRKTWP